ncbi:hypothetical protein HY634_04045 [Candidatus Uhrbacteria bacterium]|nr:hypothetical protein [Candidatus Uhrbacteria bacterium]
MHSLDQPRTESERRPPRILETKWFDERGAVRSVVTYGYDGDGRLTQEERRYGVGDPPRGKITRTLEYDGRGRLTYEYRQLEWVRPPFPGEQDSGRVVHEGEYERVYEGDTDRVVLASYAKDGNTSWMQEHAYDDRGRLVRTRRTAFDYLRPDGSPDETVEEFSYDAQDRVIERRELSEHRRVWYRNTYDESGQLSREDRGEVGSDTPFGSVRYAYADEGRTVITTNTYGGETIWVHRKRHDEHGTTIESRFTSYRRGKKDHTSVETYEHTYAQA